MSDKWSRNLSLNSGTRYSVISLTCHSFTTLKKVAISYYVILFMRQIL